MLFAQGRQQADDLHGGIREGALQCHGAVLAAAPRNDGLGHEAPERRPYLPTFRRPTAGNGPVHPATAPPWVRIRLCGRGNYREHFIYRRLESKSIISKPTGRPTHENSVARR